MEKGRKSKKVTIKGFTWTVEAVKASLNKDENLKKALLLIYSKQTEHEKVVQSSEEPNNVGFNGVDARILSSFAEQLKTKGWLSPKQMAITRKKMTKYSRQIFECIVDKFESQKTQFGL